jgi:hypothetical protein
MEQRQQEPPAENPPLPPLAAEDFSCARCGIEYPALSIEDALTAVAHQPARFRVRATAVPGPLLRIRPDPRTWSVLEYVCHVRDVFAASTVRLHRIRTEDHPALEPLFNDLRPLWFAYNNRQLLPVLDELADNACGFCEEARRMTEPDWSRQASRLPGEVRTARWLVRQTLHEAVHHGHDIRDVAARVAQKVPQ